MDKNQFLTLVNKYLSGHTSPAEEEQLSLFFNSFQPDEELDEQMLGLRQELEEKMLARLLRSVKSTKPSTIILKEKNSSRLWKNIAAAVLFFLLAGSLFYYYDNKKSSFSLTEKTKKDIAVLTPGGNKALLKLADGSTIVLNQASNGVLAMQGNTAITKTKDEQLIYKTENTGHPVENTFNTITTLVGGKYQLTLPDGTKVWLNAASSLTFPAVFASGERKVILKGEAYFEVAKVFTSTQKGMVKMPFYVETGPARIQVLGTHFNVMAYADATDFEATLLEGSVVVQKGNAIQKIAPGEQAIITNVDASFIKVKKVNTESVMAWKEDLFLFDNSGIDDVMQQIKRWYNAEVVYEGRKPNTEFTGVLPRSSSLIKVLGLLEAAKGVRFTISGNKIIVQKK
ncbi:MAG: FecR family protein [Janthinobacterium lividum]